MPLLLVKKKTNYLICRVNIVRETFILNAFFYVCFPFLCEVKFCSGYFRQVFFHFGDKKIGRWYSNDCIGILLGGLSVGRLRRVVFL